MFCPNCGTHNADENVFCQNCGTKLSELKKVQDPPTAKQTTPQSEAPVPKPKENLTVSIPNPRSYIDSTGVSIWGPFAGYGNRRDHKGWLVPGRAERNEELIEKVGEKFKERHVKGAVLIPKTLSVRGVLEERRPYYLLKRGVATVALYVTDFGKDLFVSIASYLKPPISNFRVILLGVLLFISFFGLRWWANSLGNAVSGPTTLFGGPSIDSGSILFLICLAGPFITLAQIALVFFVPISIYKWLKERDFWALLRMPANEFNEDDLMAMEKAVEQTVRISLDEIGIPTDELIPITREERQRII